MLKHCIETKLSLTPWLVNGMSQWNVGNCIESASTYKLQAEYIGSASMARRQPVIDPTLVPKSISNGGSECVQGVSSKTGKSIIKLR